MTFFLHYLNIMKETPASQQFLGMTKSESKKQVKSTKSDNDELGLG